MSTVPKIAELQWKPHPSGRGGEIARVQFDNGYAASCLRGGPFYTDGGRFEVAVMYGGDIDYDTPITDDVLGHLTEHQANQALIEIASLPKKTESA